MSVLTLPTCFDEVADSLWSFSFSASEAEGMDYTQLQHFVNPFFTTDSKWLGTKGMMSTASSDPLKLRSPAPIQQESKHFKWIGTASQKYLHFALLQRLITRNDVKCLNRLPLCLCPLWGSVDRLPINHRLQKKNLQEAVFQEVKRPERRCDRQIVVWGFYISRSAWKMEQKMFSFKSFVSPGNCRKLGSGKASCIIVASSDSSFRNSFSAGRERQERSGKSSLDLKFCLPIRIVSSPS